MSRENAKSLPPRNYFESLRPLERKLRITHTTRDSFFDKELLMFYEGVTLLPDALKRKLLPPLETFPAPVSAATKRPGVIRIVFPEFTCVCPKTGYPDFASIIVCYLPGKLCIELKSWKLYLNSFRMVGTFHETVTVHLFDTLTRTLRPKWLFVAGDFLPRGNVDTTVVCESNMQRPQGADVLIAPLLTARCAEMKKL